MSMVGHIVFYYIPSAWASALLILDQGQCESLYTRDKQSSRFPRSFYMLPSTQFSLQRQGNRAGKKLHPTRIRDIGMTKSYQIFDGKIRSLNQHLQLMDIALTVANKKCKEQAKDTMTIAEALSSDVNIHPQLNAPARTIDINRTFTTSRIKINEQAIIELYAAFSDYCLSLIKELAHSNSKKRILGLYYSTNQKSQDSLSYKAILDLGSYDNVINEIASKIFRRIENVKSTSFQVEVFIKKLGINVPDDLKNDAILYLVVRHLIIHNNSKVDDDFNGKNKMGLVETNANRKIIINYALSSAAITKVTELCKMIDEEIIKKGLLK